MLGPEGVAHLICARLEADLPGKIMELRGRLGVDADALPDVTGVYWTESDTASVEQFPLIIVVPQQTDLDAGNSMYSTTGVGNAYEYRYHINVFAWFRGHDPESTQLGQWRLALAVREVLLTKRAYSNQSGPDYLSIDPNRLHEAYSDVEQTPKKQFIGGTRFLAEFTSQEYLTSSQGTVGRVGAPPTVTAAAAL